MSRADDPWLEYDADGFDSGSRRSTHASVRLHIGPVFRDPVGWLAGGRARGTPPEGNKIHGNDVLVVLNWDGKNITGMINPGTDNMAVKNATLNPDGWVVHLEADAKDKSGAALTYVIDGKIEDLRLPNRSITGTWKNQRESGIFKVGRQ
jgi:hypothetical protein